MTFLKRLEMTLLIGPEKCQMKNGNENEALTSYHMKVESVDFSRSIIQVRNERGCVARNHFEVKR